MFRFRRRVYLDNNATTRVDGDVVKTIRSVLIRNYGNPSSLYKISYASAELLERSRATIAGCINAKPDELYFTGSATEANNQAINSAFEHHFPSKTKVFSTPIEHPAVLSMLDYISKRGAEIEFFKVDRYGRVDIEDFCRRLDSRVFLTCAMYVNNEIGTIQDIKTLAEIAHSNGSLFFTDCVQAFGKLPVDVEELQTDYASFSAHKINGPKGIGALYARTGAPLTPFIHGGHQEKGLRAGTESLHNIAGFATAAAKTGAKLKAGGRISGLRDYFREGLKAIYPECVFNSPETGCVSNTLNVTFPGVGNALMMAGLDFRGISVSAGSACNTPTNDPSHVLKAVGLNEEQARQALRFSFSHKTSLRDIKYTLGAVREFLTEKSRAIRMLTPFEFDEAMLFNPGTYILDVRFGYDRKAIKSMPGAYEAGFWNIGKYVKLLPKDRNIVVICQTGVNSPAVAYYLMKKGFGSISFIMTGIWGWKLAHPGLYSKFAGMNVTKLTL